MGGDDRPRQFVAQPDEIVPPDGVLEARDRRLRAQRRPGQRLAVEDQLVQRVGGEPGGVVAIEIAGRQTKDPLPNQVQARVRNLPGLPRIRHAPAHSLRQAQPLVHGLEQYQAPILAGVRNVEPRDDRRPETLVSEAQLRYTVCSHRASSAACIETSNHRFYSTVERLGGSCLSSFANESS